MNYETPADLTVFIRWFWLRTLRFIDSGEADRARQTARGLAHFARRLEDKEPLHLRSQPATERLHN
jgi:hypothetical protein